MKKLNKKGAIFEDIGGLAVGIATLGIILVVALVIVAQARTQIGAQEGFNPTIEGACLNSSACNTTTLLRTGLQTVPAFVPLIVIASIGAILLGLVAMFRR